PLLVLPMAMTTGGEMVRVLPLPCGTGVEVTMKLMGFSAAEQAEASLPYGEAGPDRQLDEFHFSTQHKLVNGSLGPDAEKLPAQARGGTVAAPPPVLVNVRLPAGRPGAFGHQNSRQPGCDGISVT
ncbi:hypothetical protein Vretimale_19680, partial [Volvox reticuliferus]